MLQFITALEKAADLRPEDSENLFNLALVNFRLGDRKKAEALCRRALKADPEDRRARELLGKILE